MAAVAGNSRWRLSTCDTAMGLPGATSPRWLGSAMDATSTTPAAHVAAHTSRNRNKNGEQGTSTRRTVLQRTRGNGGTPLALSRSANNSAARTPALVVLCAERLSLAAGTA